ncbi:MAG: sialidase family protein [Pirellulaceae bacterium]
MRDTVNDCWRAITLTFLTTLFPMIALAGEPKVLDRGIAPNGPQQPQLAVDAKGNIHVVYGIGEQVRYRRSNDRGKTYTEPVDLPSTPNMSLGMRRGPRISASVKSLCVTVIGGKQGKGRDGDLLAMRSVDGGKTWTGPVQVNDQADSAREGLHAMCAGPNDELCCAWLDLRDGSTEVMASISTDGGSTWSKNVLVYKSPDGSVCECCHPSVAIDSHGRINVQLRNALKGARDIYVASSTDGGKTFGKATKLGTGSWALDACPMDGGAIAVVAGGKLASAWRRDKTVFLSLEGEREERRLGVGEQPWIAATDAGAFIVWLKKRGDVAYLLTPGSKSPIELASHAADPVIAAGPNGRGPVVAAWERRDGKNYTVQCQVVADK